MERSSSTIPQTHIFFVPNIKGLAQTVLTWKGKVFAAADADADADAADADAAEAAETDWKHKVTPERGDLIIILTKCNWLNFSDILEWNKDISSNLKTDSKTRLNLAIHLTENMPNHNCLNIILWRWKHFVEAGTAQKYFVSKCSVTFKVCLQGGN